MPTYEYNCLKCGQNFEVFQSMKDPALKVCRCGKKGKVKRLLGTGAGIIFKGTGFYETDYRRPANKGRAPGEGKADEKPKSSAAPAPSSSTPPAKS